jgi:hypothetical protein
MSDKLHSVPENTKPTIPMQSALDNTVMRARISKFPAPGVKVDSSFKTFRDEELPGILDKYLENEKSFDRTLIHGRLHVSRGLMYTRVLANVYKEMGLEPDTYATYRAIGLHDSGRKGNGADVYEESSGINLINHLKEKGIESSAYRLASANCITCGKDIETLEAGIMNSADAFEIMRVKGREGFDTGKLWFMRSPVTDTEGKVIEPNTELRDTLLDEIYEFIQMTDLPVPEERQALDKAMLEGQTEGLEELSAKAKEADQKQLDEHWAVSSSDLFEGLEGVLEQNKEKFPTLYKYYNMGE